MKQIHFFFLKAKTKKEISKCQKLINAVEKNSELRSKGCWGTASLKKMPWEGVSEKVTFEQRCEGYEGTFWGVSGRRVSQAEGTRVKARAGCGDRAWLLGRKAGMLRKLCWSQF